MKMENLYEALRLDPDNAEKIIKFLELHTTLHYDNIFDWKRNIMLGISK